MYKHLVSSYRSFFSKLFSLFPLLPLSCTSSLSNRHVFLSLLSSRLKLFGHKRHQVPRLLIALYNPKIGLHTASTLTQESDCTRRPPRIQECTRRFQALTITWIVKPLCFLSSFSLLPYTFVTRSVYYPIPFASPLVFIETTQSSLSLSSFPVELLVLPHHWWPSMCAQDHWPPFLPGILPRCLALGYQARISL